MALFVAQENWSIIIIIIIWAHLKIAIYNTVNFRWIELSVRFILYQIKRYIAT